MLAGQAARQQGDKKAGAPVLITRALMPSWLLLMLVVLPPTHEAGRRAGSPQISPYQNSL